MMNNNKTNFDLFVQFLYYLALGLFIYVLIFSLYTLCMDLLDVFFKNRLRILEVEHKMRTVASSLIKVPVPSQVNGWQAWIKPVVISLATLSIKYLFSLCCHLLPKAFYKITLLGPVIKLIVEGPESFLTDGLSPEEIKIKFEQLSKTGEVALTHVTEETNRLNTIVNRTASEIDEINLRINSIVNPVDAVNVPNVSNRDFEVELNSVAASISNQERHYQPIEPDTRVTHIGSDVFDD